MLPWFIPDIAPESIVAGLLDASGEGFESAAQEIVLLLRAAIATTHPKRTFAEKCFIMSDTETRNRFPYTKLST
jgi:hypothetical protein